MTKNLPIAGKKIQSEPTSVSLLHSPLFGELISSGGDGWFLKEVEEEDSRVTVVIIFYDEDLHVKFSFVVCYFTFLTCCRSVQY